MLKMTTMLGEHDDGEGDAGRNDAYATSNSTRNLRRMSDEKKLLFVFLFLHYFTYYFMFVFFFSCHAASSSFVWTFV